MSIGACAITVALLLSTAPTEPGPKAALIQARDFAYDANYRNDQDGLRAAIAALRPLTDDPQVRAYAHYYLSWSYWLLSASQVEAKDTAGALNSASLAVGHARSVVAARPADSDAHTMLANALIVVGVLDQAQFKQAWTELAEVRRRALELGPRNPRALLMDSGMVFWAPANQGGSQEGGIARWQEALALFDAETGVPADPMAPRWGQALSYGWTANLYLAMTPPQTANARKAAEIALRLRPDFWYVRERVLPKLREP